MTRPDSSTRMGSAPSHPLEAGGYAPGTILADRYRIVALLGRGGMGEVYRADDLKLGQPVALMVILRLMLRTERAAFVATAVVVAISSASGVRPLTLDLAQAALIGVACVVFLRRFGLLALAMGLGVNYVVRSTPWTFDLAKWFMWRPLLSLILIMGLAIWGFRNVLGRQSAFPKLRLD